MIRNYSSSMCMKGKFMVCSAYKFALAESVNSCVGEPSNGDKRKKIWRTVWGLNMPNKVKSFAWRVPKYKSKSVPSGVINNDVCGACGLGIESSGHMIWECERAREVSVSVSSFPSHGMSLGFKTSWETRFPLLVANKAKKNKGELICLRMKDEVHST